MGWLLPVDCFSNVGSQRTRAAVGQCWACDHRPWGTTWLVAICGTVSCTSRDGWLSLGTLRKASTWYSRPFFCQRPIHRHRHVRQVVHAAGHSVALLVSVDPVQRQPRPRPIVATPSATVAHSHWDSCLVRRCETSLVHLGQPVLVFILFSMRSTSRSSMVAMSIRTSSCIFQSGSARAGHGYGRKIP